jgi:Nuclear pore complex subunit
MEHYLINFSYWTLPKNKNQKNIQEKLRNTYHRKCIPADILDEMLNAIHNEVVISNAENARCKPEHTSRNYDGKDISISVESEHDSAHIRLHFMHFETPEKL